MDREFAHSGPSNCHQLLSLTHSPSSVQSWTIVLPWIYLPGHPPHWQAVKIRKQNSDEKFSFIYNLRPISFVIHVSRNLQFVHMYYLTNIGRTVAQCYSARLDTEWQRVPASPASLRCGPWARHINPSLVLVQPRKIRPDITERLLTGM